jgi:hypothetical protein
MDHDTWAMALNEDTRSLAYMETGMSRSPGRSRRGWLAVRAVAALAVVVAGLGARPLAIGSEVGPSGLAAGIAAPSDPMRTITAFTVGAASGTDWIDGSLRRPEQAPVEALSIAKDPEPRGVPAEAAVARAAPTAATVTVPPPARTAAPSPARTAPPPPPQATPAPAAVMSCPATWFCYPRLGIAGPIVPYTDCSGGTDVGTGIRSYSCLSDNYLMGHAYTQFGLVRQWVAGDIVFAWGKRFTVSGAVTQQSCGAPSFPLAALSMQTSLTSSACGAVLVVQAR